MDRPLLIGLTGGIGSGKSTIARIFEALGTPIFNSDEVAKNIINNDADAIKQVIAEFGDPYINGVLDKVKMAAIVFNDKKALEKLNNIIHPIVKSYFEGWVVDNKKKSVLIKEAAILIESGAHLYMDKIILVTASEQTRILRVMKRDNVSEQKVKNRINAQLSDKEKMTFSDYVILNDEEKMVVPQVLEVYKQLRS